MVNVSGHDTGHGAEAGSGVGIGPFTFPEPVPGKIGGLQFAPGSAPGPGGTGGAPSPAPGAGWEVYVRSYKDFSAFLCQVPPRLVTSVQFVKQLSDIGSGTISLNMDDPFWSATLADGQGTHEILDFECLWQVTQDGVPRWEFLGETVTEQLVDASEQRIVTVTGPGTIAVLKWAMAAPQGFPEIVLKLDGIQDSFSEVDSNGNGVVDTNIWNTISPAGDVYITPTTSAFSYPGGAGYALGSLYPTGTLTILATSGTTVLGATPYDATDTLISVQIVPVGSAGSATDANGNPIAYGAGLNGSQVTQFYIESLKNTAYFAMIELAGTTFSCQLSGPSGTASKVIGTYDPAQHAYWMITEQGGSGGGFGTFYFWTSPDGANWTLQWQGVHTWDATYCGLFFTATYSAAGKTAIISSINSNVTTPSYAGNLYLGEPVMGIWLDLLQLAQARGTIPFVSTTLSGSTDSFGRPWTDTQNVQVANGTDLYTLLQGSAAVVNADYVMQPGMVLQVGLTEQNAVAIGADRSQSIIFREARDELTKQRTRARNQVQNLVGAQNSDGHEISAVNSASITQFGQREAWYQTAQQVDPASMAIAAAAAVSDNSYEVLSWTLTITPNLPGKTVFQAFDVGDWIGLERPDFSAVDAVRVVAIAVQVDSTGLETHELTLVSYVQYLEQQLTYIATKLGGGYINAQGMTPVAPSKYGTGQVATYFTPAQGLSSLADVTGTGGNHSAPLVWNPATGNWQPAGTTDPVSGAVLGVQLAGPSGTVSVGPGGVTVSGAVAGVAPDGGSVVVPVPSITTTPAGTTVIDTAGTTRILVGVQGDGTVTVVESGGTAPAIPDTPAVVDGPSSLAVGWDGLLAGAAPLLDFAWTEVHVSTASGFTPSAATLQGTLSAGGGVLTAGGLVPGTTYYVRLLARNKSGAASSASVQASGVPITGGGAKVTISGTAPVSPATGDLWFDSTHGYELNQWNGSAWVAYQWGTNSIAALAVTAAQIAANTITAAQIAAGTITATQIAANTITGAKIAAGTITASNIQANTITAALLAAGIVYAGIVDSTTINTATLTAATITGGTITGSTIVDTGGGYFAYSGTPASGNLFYSDTDSSGTDAFGNAYLSGITFYGNPSSGVWIAANMNTVSSAFGMNLYTATSSGGPWTIDSWLRRSGSSAGQLEIGPIAEFLNTSLLPATPTAGAKLWSPSSGTQLRVMKGDGEPGYGVGETIYSTNSDQTISTGWATAISGGGVSLSVHVLAGETYFFEGTFWVNLATSFQIDLGVTGPAINSAQWFWQGHTTPTILVNTTLTFEPPTPAAGDYFARIWGSFNPSATGTFSMGAGKVANNFTVKAGTYLRVRTHH